MGSGKRPDLRELHAVTLHQALAGAFPDLFNQLRPSPSEWRNWFPHFNRRSNWKKKKKKGKNLQSVKDGWKIATPFWCLLIHLSVVIYVLLLLCRCLFIFFLSFLTIVYTHCLWFPRLLLCCSFLFSWLDSSISNAYMRRWWLNRDNIDSFSFSVVVVIVDAVLGHLFFVFFIFLLFSLLYNVSWDRFDCYGVMDRRDRRQKSRSRYTIVHRSIR